MDTLIVRETAPGAFEVVPYGSSFTGSDNALHGWKVPTLWTDAGLATIGVYRVAPVVTPAGTKLVSQSFERDALGSVVAVGVFEDVSPPPPSDLLAYTADVRWQKETGGIMVATSIGVIPVSTERGDDRDALQNVYSALRDGLRPDGATFKFADDVPRSVPNADMMKVVVSAFAFVQKCFDKEANITAQFKAGMITSKVQIDAQFAALNTVY